MTIYNETYRWAAVDPRGAGGADEQGKDDEAADEQPGVPRWPP